MKYGNLTLGQIEALINILGGMEKVESLLRGEPLQLPQHPIDKGGWFNVVVDYDRSLAEFLQDNGLTPVHELRRVNFPITLSGVVEQKVRVAKLTWCSTPENVRMELETLKLQHATLEELIASNSFLTELLRNNERVAALGSTLAQARTYNSGPNKGMKYVVTMAPVLKWNHIRSKPEIEMVDIERDIYDGYTDFWKYHNNFLVKLQ